jgi:thiol-disulfide isomerase/thioredoxin
MVGNALDETESWIAAQPLALLVLTTPDCGVCNAIKPNLADLAARYDLLQLRYLDVSEVPQAAGRFEVFAVPVLILYVQGRESVRFARHFGMGEVEAAVSRYASLLGEP